MVRPRHRARQAVCHVLDRVPGPFYGTYEPDPSGRVGTIDAGIATAVDALRGASYSYNAVAATPVHPDTGRTDDGSYRRVDPSGPDRQWHVHLFERTEASGPTPRVEVFSHYEYTPLWPPDLRRAREHYWADYGETYLPGRHCERLGRALETHGRYAGDPSKLGSASLPAP